MKKTAIIWSVLASQFIFLGTAMAAPQAVQYYSLAMSDPTVLTRSKAADTANGPGYTYSEGEAVLLCAAAVN